MFESTDPRGIDGEFGWPAQRIRLGLGLLLFVLFELSIARQLPASLVLFALAIGVASLFSAALELKDVRLRMQIHAISSALTEPRSSWLP